MHAKTDEQQLFDNLQESGTNVSERSAFRLFFDQIDLDQTMPILPFPAAGSTQTIRYLTKYRVCPALLFVGSINPSRSCGTPPDNVVVMSALLTSSSP